MNSEISSNQIPRRRAEDLHFKISRPGFKFIIGFIAGFSAAIFPRLTALMLVPHGENNLNIISAGYLFYSLLFAVLIGAVIMIMEWRLPKEPRITFMSALGIPAILTGSFNTLDSASALDLQTEENKRLNQLVEQALDITIIRGDKIKPISLQNNPPLPSLGFSFISEAHAQEDNITRLAQNRANPSIQPVQAHYIVVLDKRPTRDAAIARANELNNTIPAQAISSGGDYFIIKKGQPTNRSNALIEAIRIRNDFQIRAEVLELQ